MENFFGKIKMPIKCSRKKHFSTAFRWCTGEGFHERLQKKAAKNTA
jgi:hypothetical protein